MTRSKREVKREWEKRNPEKNRAHNIVDHARRRGKLIKKPCEVCGFDDMKFVHAHHDDYSKPLDVRWLCDKHHKEHHKKSPTPPAVIPPRHVVKPYNRKSVPIAGSGEVVNNN